jgi:lysozyme
MIFGVDVSKHNGTLDWAAAKRAGIEFMIARAVLCTTPDATYYGNVRRARANGIQPGAYHFLYNSAWVPAARQADVFMDMIGDPEGLLVALDVEVDGASKPTWGDVKAFVDRWNQRYPAHPLLGYGSAYLDAIARGRGPYIGPLWRARYVDQVMAAGHSPQADYTLTSSSWWGAFDGWSGASILQFTSVARVPGIGDDTVDANAFRGTRAELEKLAYAIRPPDTSTEEPTTMATAINAGGRDLASSTVVDAKAGTILYADDAGTVLTKLSQDAVLDDFGQPAKVGHSDYRYVRVQSGAFDDDPDLEEGLVLVKTAAVSDPRPKTAAQLRGTADRFAPCPPPATTDCTTAIAEAVRAAKSETLDRAADVATTAIGGLKDG